jgi:hypothetical protein
MERHPALPSNLEPSPVADKGVVPGRFYTRHFCVLPFFAPRSAPAPPVTDRHGLFPSTHKPGKVSFDAS